MTEKEKDGSGGKTRREFLKDAGLLVGGTAIGSTVLLAACGGDGETTTKTVTNTVTTSVTATKFVDPIDGMEFNTLAELKAHFEMAHAGMDVPGLAILTVNGKSYYTKVKPNWPLSYVLREKLGFTGTKVACEKGDCGVCTVIMDGRPVLSCLVLAIEAQDKAIETVEGLAGNDGTLHPLQTAFIKNDGMQCGFCTPGQLMTAKALLDAKSSLTMDEAKEHMAGTLCRCGAHPAIIQSILETAG